MFVTQFAEFLVSVVMTTEPLVLAGEFNIHVNVKTDNDAANFLDLLSSMGLHQHIDFPSHISGNTLDLLISRTLNSNLIQDVRPGTYFSHHCLALFIINISIPQLSRKKASFGKTKAIDITAFMENLSASGLCQDPPSEPAKSIDCYNTIRVFIRHRGSENSPAKFQRPVAIFLFRCGAVQKNNFSFM